MLKERKLQFLNIISKAEQIIDEILNETDDNTFLNEIKRICEYYFPLFSFFKNNNKLTDSNIGLIEEKIVKIENNKRKSYNLNRYQRNGLFKKVIVEFNQELSSVIDNNIDKIKNKFEKNSKGLPQTFLSYAYVDKGITLILFFYFLANGGYLYVDWMHSPAYPNGLVIKESLSEALNSSKQFLFLYTPNSQVKTGEKMSLKEWCSWEFGGFYFLHKCEKFYIRIPNNFGNYYVPDILDTFKIMDGVDSGIIYGHNRFIMDYYIPGQHLERQALNLLTYYVYKSYGNYKLSNETTSDHSHDAYNAMTKTSLDFIVICDKTEDNRYEFSSEMIENKENRIYNTLRRIINKKVERENNKSDKVELVVILPTRESNSLSMDEKESLMEDMSYLGLYYKKIYLIYVDLIYEFKISKRPIPKKYYYKEEDM